MITQPGLVDGLSNDAYHAETEWLSSSMLKGLLPENYKVTASQEALDFGTLFHTVVLEPDDIAGYAVLDAEKIGVKSDGTAAQNPTMTAAWKKAVTEAEQDGRKVIAQADLDRAYAMRDAILTHDTAARLLFEDDGRNELSAFAVDEDGIQHRCRYDRLISGIGVDLKSTASKPGRESISRAVIDYGYDLQADHYLTVGNLLGLDLQAFAFVFVRKEPPHHVTVCDLDEAFLARGRRLRARAIERHLNPAALRYEGASGFLTLNAPAWALRTEEYA